jgi:hypothetical protein
MCAWRLHVPVCSRPSPGSVAEDAAGFHAPSLAFGMQFCSRSNQAARCQRLALVLPLLRHFTVTCRWLARLDSLWVSIRYVGARPSVVATVPEKPRPNTLRPALPRPACCAPAGGAPAQPAYTAPHRGLPPHCGGPQATSRPHQSQHRQSRDVPKNHARGHSSTGAGGSSGT